MSTTKFDPEVTIENVEPGSGSAEAWPKDNRLEIDVTLTKPTTGRRVKRPYLAVWIENADGKPVRTLAVWAPLALPVACLGWAYWGTFVELASTWQTNPQY